MSIVRSARAVMAARIEPRESKEYFPTPPWATRALCTKLLELGYYPSKSTVWEPACGEGYMARPLDEFFETLWASDIKDYGWSGLQANFDFISLQPDQMFRGQPDFISGEVDWVITNPPFTLAEEFLSASLAVAKIGVALFLPLRWLEGIERYTLIFGPEGNKPNYVCQFAERVPILKGVVKRNASTATAYAWFIWLNDQSAPQMQLSHIAPCRDRLERHEDYAPTSPVIPVAAPLLELEAKVTC